MTQEMRGGILVQVCNRLGCGHPKHSHLTSPPTTCITETVSGPSTDRKVVSCQCPGFLA